MTDETDAERAWRCFIPRFETWEAETEGTLKMGLVIAGDFMAASEELMSDYYQET